MLVSLVRPHDDGLVEAVTPPRGLTTAELGAEALDGGRAPAAGWLSGMGGSRLLGAAAEDPHVDLGLHPARPAVTPYRMTWCRSGRPLSASSSLAADVLYHRVRRAGVRGPLRTATPPGGEVRRRRPAGHAGAAAGRRAERSPGACRMAGPAPAARGGRRPGGAWCDDPRSRSRGLPDGARRRPKGREGD